MLQKIFKPYKSNKQNLLRIGPKSDGGYIIDKRVIKKTSVIISCGLNDDWEFEKYFLKLNPSCKIIAYDHTINKKFWKDRFKKDLISLILFKKLRFKKILDVFKYIDYRSFFNEKNIHYIKKVVLKKKNKNEISIKNILLGHKDLILKVDIEGDEYKILNHVKKDYKKINLLIIEFHNITQNFKKIKKFISKSRYRLIHIHGNNYAGLDKFKNPNVIECTFINNKKFKVSRFKSKYKYPIPNLDFKNFKRREDIEINFND